MKLKASRNLSFGQGIIKSGESFNLDDQSLIDQLIEKGYADEIKMGRPSKKEKENEVSE